MTDRRHTLGVTFMVVALLMVIQGVYLSVKQNRESACQSDYNASVVAVQKQRAQWADEDRKALNDMIFAVISPKATQGEKQQAVQQYVSTARTNDKNRKENPLPERTSCSYGWL